MQKLSSVFSPSRCISGMSGVLEGALSALLTLMISIPPGVYGRTQFCQQEGNL